MNITGKVHCFFEQSGVFKNEFKKLGYDALDYDIQNNFGQTDFVLDLFGEIEKAYGGKFGIFDSITPDDLIIAFFPCIYFEALQQVDFACVRNGTTDKPLYERIDRALQRLKHRTLFHSMLYKLTSVCDKRKLRLIIENPATAPNYLITGQNFLPPTIIDKNRMTRGDYYKKPTAYWFINCEPTYGESYQNDKEQKTILHSARSKTAGLCSQERSMISSDYARNWICDFVLGKAQPNTQQMLF